ncbi:hypothetical protein AMTR_s00181p00015760 [Amborella trichopoda]|uniref:Uncharacterized protein n=1 Tax=Amborella trichopoda TaxID=13333 RepID=W1P7R8_AMBTC|nr:hypothetical protein AMTR_s00181p00015760 [Amborella trichopoda]
MRVVDERNEEGDLELQSPRVNGIENMLQFTSWCRLGIYEMDFGWGRPEWVAMNFRFYKNIVVLMDTKSGDGIEAWISLPETEIARLEFDPQLLSFVSKIY